MALEGLTERLNELERVGFLLIEGALSPAETEHVRQRIDHARSMGWEEGLNAVGNMWFDSLLDREPETFASLVAHTSVRPVLDGMMGPQCQLRSFRAHINPGAYVQEWHMDFYGYWEEKRRCEGPRLAVQPTGVNTTFYMQDNDPGEPWGAGRRAPALRTRPRTWAGPSATGAAARPGGPSLMNLRWPWRLRRVPQSHPPSGRQGA
jgi:hypothetical protein